MHFQIIRGNQAKHHDLCGALAGLDQPDMIRGILGPPLSYVIAGPAVDDGIHSEILLITEQDDGHFFLKLVQSPQASFKSGLFEVVY